MDKSVRTLPVIQPGQSSDTPLVFEKVAVVGLGLIGGSIALASREAWPNCLVIGVDNKTVLEQAMVRHAIDIAADDLVVIAEADIVILASPVRENISVLGELEQYVNGSVIVTDVDDSSSEAVAQLQEFAIGLGAVPHVMQADEHDQLLAFLSHLPQLTASALMHVVGSSIGVEGLRLTGRGLADTTRLASSPPDIWRDICATNSDDLATALDVLIEQLQEIRNDLDGGEAITRVFESAGRWREVLAAEHDPQKNKR